MSDICPFFFYLNAESLKNVGGVFFFYFIIFHIEKMHTLYIHIYIYIYISGVKISTLTQEIIFFRLTRKKYLTQLKQGRG